MKDTPSLYLQAVLTSQGQICFTNKKHVDQHWVQNDALLHTVYYATQHDGLQHDETPLPPQKCMYLFRLIEHRLHNETILQTDPILTKGL